jgi:hypothetical protein
MVVISVDVPEEIAKKFVSQSIVQSDSLYQELDKEIWNTVAVQEDAEVVLDFLKSMR